MTGGQHPEKYSADPRVSAGIIKKAQSFPEVLAGVARLDILRESPSYRMIRMARTRVWCAIADSVNWPAPWEPGPKAVSLLLRRLVCPLARQPLEMWGAATVPHALAGNTLCQLWGMTRSAGIMGAQ